MNLSWITPTLALGGRLSDAELGRLRVDQTIAAVVDLRSEALDDAEILQQQDIDFLHLPIEDHAALPPTVLDMGIAFLSRHVGAGHRALVHCEHGIGRSATLALAALVAQGFTPLDALNLAKDRRERVSPSPAQYDAWRDWLRQRQARSGESWEIPTFDSFASVAYRHLRSPMP